MPHGEEWGTIPHLAEKKEPVTLAVTGGNRGFPRRTPVGAQCEQGIRRKWLQSAPSAVPGCQERCMYERIGWRATMRPFDGSGSNGGGQILRAGTDTDTPEMKAVLWYLLKKIFN